MASWDGRIQIIGTTNGYITLSGVTEVLSSNVTIETRDIRGGWDGVMIDVEVDFDATPTDDVEVNIYGSLDGVTYDNVPLYSFIVSKDLDPSILSFRIDYIPNLKVGIKQTGATDSHNVRVYMKRWKHD